MSDEPTEKQLAFLKRLKYEGPAPLTKKEASWLIDARKSGRKGSALAADVTKARQQGTKKWLADQRRYKRNEISQARDSYGAIAGFRLCDSIQCPIMSDCAGAFVPIQVATKHPDALPPGKQCTAEICDCSCDFEVVMEDDVLSRKAKMVVKPGRITTVGKRQKPRRLSRLLIAIIIAVVLYYLFK